MGKKAPGSIDLFSYNEIIFLKRETSQLHLLTEWTVLEDFPAFRKDIEKFYAGCYVVELLTDLSEEGDADTSLFHLLLETLYSLSGNHNRDLTVLTFELQLLRYQGYLPDLGQCTQCGEKFPRNSRAALSHFQKGLLCKNCASDMVGASASGFPPQADDLSRNGGLVPLQLSPAAIGAANFLVDCKLSSANRLHMPEKVLQELKKLSAEYLSQVLGRPIEAWK
jgi:recombinational DNA repair protein (RecF pathway)